MQMIPFSSCKYGKINSIHSKKIINIYSACNSNNSINIQHNCLQIRQIDKVSPSLFTQLNENKERLLNIENIKKGPQTI